jgi:hypothetical protein
VLDRVEVLVVVLVRVLVLVLVLTMVVVELPPAKNPTYPPAATITMTTATAIAATEVLTPFLFSLIFGVWANSGRICISSKESIESVLTYRRYCALRMYSESDRQGLRITGHHMPGTHRT